MTLITRMRSHPSFADVERLYQSGETRVETIAESTGLPRDTIRAMLRLLAGNDPRYAEWSRDEKIRTQTKWAARERKAEITEPENAFVRLGAERVRMILEDAAKIPTDDTHDARRDRAHILAERFRVPARFVHRIIDLGPHAIVLAVERAQQWKDEHVDALWQDPVVARRKARMQAREDGEGRAVSASIPKSEPAARRPW